MNTKSVGERTEAIVLAELLKVGYVVLLPFGDNQRYDLVIEQDGIFKRVQCKTAQLSARSENALVFPTCSTYAHRGRSSKDYRGAADYFGVYSPDTGQCYLVPVDAVGVKVAHLRLAPARNGQVANVRLAQDYLLKLEVPERKSHGSVGESGRPRRPVKAKTAGSNPVRTAYFEAFRPARVSRMSCSASVSRRK